MKKAAAGGDSSGEANNPIVESPWTIPKGFSLFSDIPALTLVISNIITLVLAIAEGWSLVTILFIYWSQSVIIGVFNFIKIISLKKFTTDGFKINGKHTVPSEATKWFIAFFFAVHYGIFHLVYFVFLIAFLFTGGFDLVAIFAMTAIFFANHLYSFVRNYSAEQKKERNISSVMMFPYARILPMHLTIIFGGIFMGISGGLTWIPLIIFMSLKTVSDVVMHLIEHRK